ncbi:glycosyltransferase family A protein [Lentzea sp. NPDC005914]|uniref:glycosyltransferase family A protein n=1 Tax=Lentzea sp. NPDC005914 TaxID=3154572 RepID=UPI0033C58E03
MTSPDLCLVSAVGGSVFMEELLEVVADAVRRAGGRARTALGRFPEPSSDTVYVVVPHEYFYVTPVADRPAPELLRRTIAFCVEHPGTMTFDRTASLVGSLAGAVDINVDSTEELRRRGVAVEHFQLGYTPLWDRWGGDPDSDRSIDVTYLGTAERRRSLLLNGYSRDLDEQRVRLLTPPHEPMGPARIDFLPGEAKFAHLADSRFLINLHREQSKALEWVRVLEALTNGCVVLTEPSTDVEPLVPGKHLVVASAASLGAVAAALTSDVGRERDLRMAGYDFVRNDLDMLGSARTLIELATSLVDGKDVAPLPSLQEPAPVSAEKPLAVDTSSWDPKFAGVASLGREVSDAEKMACALAVERTTFAQRAAGRDWQDHSPASAGSGVDVLIVQRPGEPDPDGLILDLLGGTVRPERILVCVDGTPAPSKSNATAVLHHEMPLGRGVARNGLLERSTADHVLVLDAGLRASRHLLARLLAADADVAHCPIGDPQAGLVAALPAERRRLAQTPYLGCGYLVRRPVLDEMGGWTVDPLLEGLEDHAFWRSVKSSVLVQQVLLQRQVPDPPIRPVDLHPQRVWATFC